MNDIPQAAQLSGEMVQTMFASHITNMIVLDLAIAATIVLAHRFFVTNERRINATSHTRKD